MKWFVSDLRVSVEGTPERLQTFLSSLTAAQPSIVLIERLQLVECTSLDKDKVKKGDVLAVGTGGKPARGEITGIYFRGLEFQLSSASKSFEYSSSHADAIIRQFIEQQHQETKIKGIKVLHVQNVNGKVRGKVLVKIQGILAKPEYLKEKLND